MKALIIGIDSNIGKALASALRIDGWDVYGTSRRSSANNTQTFYVDLELHDTFGNISGEFDIVYACAALPNMVLCENNPKLSQQINVDAQIGLAKHCISKTNNYVFLSTTAVFDGCIPKPTIDTKTTPRCIYGLHKSMAENALLSFSPKITIVRTSKVITENYKLIVDWIRDLENDLIIEPFHDLNFSPVPINNLIELLQKVATKRMHNILHISGHDDIPYSDLAYMIAHRLQKPKHLVQPKSYKSAGLTTNLTFLFSSLDMSQTTNLYGLLAAKSEEILNLVLKGHRNYVSN